MVNECAHPHEWGIGGPARVAHTIFFYRSTYVTRVVEAGSSRSGALCTKKNDLQRIKKKEFNQFLKVCLASVK